MNIFIDADGCPVVKETVALSKKNNLPVTIVKNYARKSLSFRPFYTRDGKEFFIL